MVSPTLQLDWARRIEKSWLGRTGPYRTLRLLLERRVDRAKAEDLGRKLIGRTLDGWLVGSLVNNGKSAAVFRAEMVDRVAAIKVYDAELLSKYGDLSQLERLNREKSLIEHGHPNLVAVFASGYDSATGCHYLTMEYLDNKDLAQTLEEIPPENIGMLIEQLASAAKFLEDRNYAHRDIKPANIVVVDNYSRLILLDFGVIKPLGESGPTDHGADPLFVGTNQYASPEFAMRKEENTLEAWRAVTFYQIGAVVHDLVMKRPIFGHASSVPARLANAVQTEVPVLESSTVPAYLIKLARACLVKSPQARLELVTWDSFKEVHHTGRAMADITERIKARIDAAVIREREASQHRLPGNALQSFEFHVEETLMESLRGAGSNGFPLPRSVVHRRKVVPQYISAIFEPSVELSLPKGLSVALDFRVVDLMSKMVEVRGSTYNGMDAPDWQPDFNFEVHKGAFTEDELRNSVLSFLLKVIDDAQTSAVRAMGF